jgi:two-component sensor histidine kinase
MLSPLDPERESLVLGVVRDATERKRTEARAEEARDMYFKEVHHRVKNNLQVISSLLALQSAETSDPHTLAILRESRNRVKSIALIHEKLYRSAELTTVHFADYVRDLVADLVHTYGVTHHGLTVRTEVEDTALEIDTAVPCGLIINELVSNALKHAFPAGATGELVISLRRIGPRQHHLTVRDTGVGLPGDGDWRSSHSLGLRLVSDLTRQLDGDIDIDSGPRGTTVAIVFRELHYTERR